MGAIRTKNRFQWVEWHIDYHSTTSTLKQSARQTTFSNMYYWNNITVLCNRYSNFTEVFLQPVSENKEHCFKVMVWCRVSNAPLPEPLMTSFNERYMHHQGIYWLSHTTSYLEISQSLEYARSVLRVFKSFWNLLDNSTAVQPRSLSNFKNDDRLLTFNLETLRYLTIRRPLRYLMGTRPQCNCADNPNTLLQTHMPCSTMYLIDQSPPMVLNSYFWLENSYPSQNAI